MEARSAARCGIASVPSREYAEAWPRVDEAIRRSWRIAPDTCSSPAGWPSSRSAGSSTIWRSEGGLRGRGRRPADLRGRPDDAPLGRATPGGPRGHRPGHPARPLPAATSARSLEKAAGSRSSAVPVTCATCPGISARPIGRRPNTATYQHRDPGGDQSCPAACRSRN